MSHNYFGQEFWLLNIADGQRYDYDRTFRHEYVSLFAGLLATELYSDQQPLERVLSRHSQCQQYPQADWPQQWRSRQFEICAIALGFRGYAYLQLTYLYQHSYYTLGADGTKWGRGEKYDFSQSPVYRDTEDGRHSSPRATVAQIYEQIKSDLTTAFDLFKNLDMTRTSSPTDMDGCVVAMHLARANMVIHEWWGDKYAAIDNIQSEDQILWIQYQLTDVFGCIQQTIVRLIRRLSSRRWIAMVMGMPGASGGALPLSHW